jgi:hypothetical protein
VETGRFVNLALENRTCEICDSVSVEDQCHFLFECEKYHELRENCNHILLVQCILSFVHVLRKNLPIWF